MSPETVSLPEGTVTVLSTDVVGSTLLNQRLGDEAATAVERDLAALAQERLPTFLRPMPAHVLI
jgi:class 3 adenylate cyclase